MNHFDYLSQEDRRKIFWAPPKPFHRNGDKAFIAHALGATLYMPATRPTISRDLMSRKIKGLMSVVLCLEDAIGDRQVREAERALATHLRALHDASGDDGTESPELPFLFVRVREPHQLDRLASLAGSALSVLTGFVFPKFSGSNGWEYFRRLERINAEGDVPYYAMPILEAPDVIYWEKRRDALRKINEIVDAYDRFVLNLRIGATDFSGLFGLRRGFDVTIYDIQVIRDCMTDIINNFCRADRDHVVSAPVWEYFHSGERVLKPLLRSTPFQRRYGETGKELRSRLLNRYLDGLIHETLLDKANGLMGKTVIHPSHIIPVQSMYVVHQEEYTDALSIVENHGKTGVVKSLFRNKMNEIKPHTNWARKILMRSRIYGVFHSDTDFFNLLQCS